MDASVHDADDAAVGHQPLALFTGVLGCLDPSGAVARSAC